MNELQRQLDALAERTTQRIEEYVLGFGPDDVEAWWGTSQPHDDGANGVVRAALDSATSELVELLQDYMLHSDDWLTPKEAAKRHERVKALLLDF